MELLACLRCSSSAAVVVTHGSTACLPATACLPPQLFQRCWFAGRDVLDIGCNEGLVTLAVARRFGPRHVTGVDIDEVLIRKACRWVLY